MQTQDPTARAASFIAAASQLPGEPVSAATIVHMPARGEPAPALVLDAAADLDVDDAMPVQPAAPHRMPACDGGFWYGARCVAYLAAAAAGAYLSWTGDEELGFGIACGSAAALGVDTWRFIAGVIVPQPFAADPQDPPA